MYGYILEQTAHRSYKRVLQAGCGGPAVVLLGPETAVQKEPSVQDAYHPAGRSFVVFLAKIRYWNKKDRSVRMF